MINLKIFVLVYGIFIALVFNLQTIYNFVKFEKRMKKFLKSGEITCIRTYAHKQWRRKQGEFCRQKFIKIRPCVLISPSFSYHTTLMSPYVPTTFVATVCIFTDIMYVCICIYVCKYGLPPLLFRRWFLIYFLLNIHSIYRVMLQFL